MWEFLPGIRCAYLVLVGNVPASAWSIKLKSSSINKKVSPDTKQIKAAVQVLEQTKLKSKAPK